MIDPFDGPLVRVGDAERDQAIAVLHQAAVDGRLTAVELDDRMGRALASRTRGELRGLLEDLVPRAPLAEMLTGAPAARNLGPGYSWEDPLVITAKWSDESRIGAWEVPPFLEVHPVVSNVKLNFMDAIPVSLLIDVVLVGGAGNLVLVVPGDWGVDITRVQKGMGSARSKVEPRPHYGRPQLVVRGGLALGDLRVRYPGGFDTWQLKRARAKLARRALRGA